jgi:plasmid stability protein
VPSLTISDVPPRLYAQLEIWAVISNRSVSDEVIALLEREADSRRKDLWRTVEELHSEIELSPNAPHPEDIIREDRDHGHRF